MRFEVGKRFVTRSGAVVRIVQVFSDPRWRFLVAVVERCFDGSVPDPAEPCKISLCPDGRYYPHDEDHELDLMNEVAVFGKVAA